MYTDKKKVILLYYPSIDGERSVLTLRNLYLTHTIYIVIYGIQRKVEKETLLLYKK